MFKLLRKMVKFKLSFVKLELSKKFKPKAMKHCEDEFISSLSQLLSESIFLSNDEIIDTILKEKREKLERMYGRQTGVEVYLYDCKKKIEKTLEACNAKQLEREEEQKK